VDRQGGNFAASSGKPSVELKSQDLLLYNVGSPDPAPAALTYGSAQSAAGTAKSICDAYAAQFNPPLTPVYGFLFQGCNAGTMLPLNSMQVGSALNQRIGRKVTMRSVKINMTIRAPTTSTVIADGGYVYGSSPAVINTQNIIRIILVYDRQTNCAAPGYSDVLASPGSSGVSGSGAGTGVVGVASSNNLNNRSRFLTVFDKNYTFGSTDAVQKHVQIYKKLNLPVIYTSNNPASNPYDVSVISTGGLFLMYVSDGVATIGPAVALTVFSRTPWGALGSCRIRFTDA